MTVRPSNSQNINNYWNDCHANCCENVCCVLFDIFIYLFISRYILFVLFHENQHLFTRANHDYFIFLNLPTKKPQASPECASVVSEQNCSQQKSFNLVSQTLTLHIFLLKWVKYPLLCSTPISLFNFNVFFILKGWMGLFFLGNIQLWSILKMSFWI